MSSISVNNSEANLQDLQRQLDTANGELDRTKASLTKANSQLYWINNGWKIKTGGLLAAVGMVFDVAKNHIDTLTQGAANLGAKLGFAGGHLAVGTQYFQVASKVPLKVLSPLISPSTAVAGLAGLGALGMGLRLTRDIYKYRKNIRPEFQDLLRKTLEEQKTEKIPNLETIPQKEASPNHPDHEMTASTDIVMTSEKTSSTEKELLPVENERSPSPEKTLRRSTRIAGKITKAKSPERTPKINKSKMSGQKTLQKDH